MSVPFEPRGAWTALATPFAEDGSFDEGTFRKLVEFQVSEGISGVLPCGTTGESPTLNWQEHDRIIEVAVDQVGGRVGVLAGTGSNNTAEAIRGTAHAREVGVSAALLVDCYYNGPSSLELREDYYERVLAEVPDLPIVPYIIPGRSGCALAAADLAILHQRDPSRVPAVKQATGDLERMALDRQLAGDSLAIFSGDDDLTLTMMADEAIGCSGVISVMSNLVPRAMSHMVASQAAGDATAARIVADQIQPLLCLVTCAVTSNRTLPDGREVEVTDKFRNPAALKTMMAGLGMLGPVARAPLGLLTAEAVDLCRDSLRQVHEASPEHLAPIESAFGVRIADRLADDVAWAPLTR